MGEALLSIDDDALSRLRKLIEDGHQTRAGRLPSERQLAQELGIGRTVLRSALGQLEAEGLIWRRQGHGTFVSAVSPQNATQLVDIGERTSPSEIMEVRMSIEPMLARLCASRANDRQIRKIVDATRRASEATSVTAFKSWDTILHRLIAEGAGNTLFLSIFDAIRSVTQRLDWSSLRMEATSMAISGEVIAEHEKIVEAMMRRDPAAAEDAMRKHLDAVFSRILSRRRD
jgi:DNA-binding FadR family transcriptional regulator